ncbi:MAG: efflux RND transporter periplasmic adaptor subunit, partial [Sneathiella sp.]|nr:efflux RND transporter periplasmic adaptor subunit [Sneathiella sp.]
QQKATLQRQKIALSMAERDLENTRLLAPFSGYLSNISVELGKRIDAKDPVAKIIDATHMEAQFHLSNQQYGILLDSPKGVIGRKVKTTWSVGQSSHTFGGEIARIGSEIKSETGGVEIYAVLNNTAELQLLRPGAFVDVTLNSISFENAVQLPDHAVFEDNIVYIVEDGRLQPRKIEILSHDGTNLIVGGDLNAGDKILTSRFAEVGPGIKVEVR